MTPKADRSELIAVRVLHEQRWAYERTLEHLSYRAMRTLANHPPERGGLGYDLSEHALKSLVKGYRDRMAEVEARTLEEHRERELADLDDEHRMLSELLGPIDTGRAAVIAKHFGYDSIEAFVIDNPTADVWRDDGVRLRALRERRAVGESRRRLLGLDAPQSVKVDVTTHDAVADELNAMLALLDPKGERTDAEEPGR